ncbi:MAG: TraB/GumN family protein [Sphingomicrobium sp.]
MLKTILHRGLGLLGLAALGSCATPSAPEAVATAKPALWQVSDADTTVYLFGTIHLLPQNYKWRSAEFDKAVANSQSLVVETIVDLQNPEQYQAMVQRLGFAEGLPPLAQRVPPELRPKLQAAIAQSPIPAAAYDKMETWFAGLTLLQLQFSRIGLAGSEGVEETLKKQFTSSSRPIGELETNAEQLGYFDALPEYSQRELLKGAIEDPNEMRAQFGGMLESWARGDLAGIAKTFDADMAEVPALRDALIVRRNANWSEWVRRRMATQGTVMVAVGAGHLAGTESVISRLERDGLKVRRIQ